jgi:hypothetical protein
LCSSPIPPFLIKILQAQGNQLVSKGSYRGYQNEGYRSNVSALIMARIKSLSISPRRACDSRSGLLLGWGTSSEKGIMMVRYLRPVGHAVWISGMTPQPKSPLDALDLLPCGIIPEFDRSTPSFQLLCSEKRNGRVVLARGFSCMVPLLRNLRRRYLA